MKEGESYSNMSITDATKKVFDTGGKAVTAIGEATGGMNEVQGFVTRQLASKAVGLALVSILHPKSNSGKN